MGIDLSTWRACIGLNYYHMCRPLQTRWRSSGGQLYQPGVASWGVGEVMNNTPLVLKGCMTVIALTLILQYVYMVHSGFKLKGRVVSGKVHCHLQGSTSQVRGIVDGGGTLLLRAIVVVIPLLLVIAGDVETNPGPGVPSLKLLLNKLHPVRASWYVFGLQLDIPHTELDCIERKHSNQVNLLCEVLKYWFKTAVDPRPTWEAVVTALRSCTVNERFVAHQLELEYCTQHKTDDSNTPTIADRTQDDEVDSFGRKKPKHVTAVEEELHFNIGVSEPSLKALLHELHPVRASWYNIGLELDIPHSTLNGFKPMYSDQLDLMRETLMYWLDTAVDPPPTWEAVVKALRSPIVDMKYVADQLESMYCAAKESEDNEGVHDQITSSSNEERSKSLTASAARPSDSTSPTPTQKPLYGEYQVSDKHSTDNLPLQDIDTSGPTRPHAVEDQYFDNKFGSLVDETCQEVIGKTKPSIFLSIVTYLSSSTQNRSFIKEKLTNIPPPVTFVKIWSILNLHWDFLNYGLLKHVINTYGSLELKKKMQNYVDELSTCEQQNQLSDFIKNSPRRDEGPPEEYLKLVVVKQSRTLKDVESFKTALVHMFFPPESDILLQNDTEGSFCVCLTSPSIATHLQQNLTNIEAEFFKKQCIDTVTIDGRDIYLTTVEKYGGYLKELYSSQQCPVGIGPLTPTEELLPFDLARIEKDKLKVGIYDHEFTTRNMRGDRDDVGSLGTEFYKKSPIKLEEVGKSSSDHRQKLVLIEGAPGVGKTTFSWEFCRKWGKGEILLDHSLLLLLPLRDNSLKIAKTLSDLFIHPNSELQHAVIQEVTSNQGQGVAIWLEAWDELDPEQREKASVFLDLIHGRILPLATVLITSRPWASENIRKNCGHRISQHVEILASAKDQIAHYIGKAGAEAQPSSFAAKFTDYLSSYPVIRAAMYTPVTAKMSAEVFSWSQHTESPPPTTITELFTTFTLKTLVDHLSTHPVYHKQQLKFTTFSDLPTDVYKQFQDLCKMAYEGILNRQQLVFSAAHLPTGFAPLGLMQEVPQLYTKGRASSYHFLHLTLQEYLAAIHISQLPANNQQKLFREHLDSGYFKMTIKFLAGLTKLANMPTDIATSLTESDDTKLRYFHFLFEAKANNILVITESLDLDEMVVRPHYSWTPLDYYVMGHVISHSNCPWRLYFRYSSIDDEKFELFCQGCAAPGATGCRGHISHANFSENGISSKSVQSFLNIPPHILQMTELELHHNKLERNACDLLAKAVPSMSRLRRLWLSYNPIESGGAMEVIKALHGSGVKQLWLDNAGIGVPDCKALCELLKSSHSLEELKIYGNYLSSESVASIITGLSHNSSLTDLDISTSHFSMANVISLASVLKHCTSESKLKLKMLNLQDCHINSEGAVELAAALCKNTTLEYLNLSHNPIGKHVEGVTAVAKMLIEVRGSKFTLTQLELRDCHISGQGARKLAAALCENSTLKHLNLNHNHIGVEGASSISDMLRHNKSLEVLHLRNESVGEEGVRKLIHDLKHNQTLRKLVLPKTYKTENSDQRIEWY